MRDVFVTDTAGKMLVGWSVEPLDSPQDAAFGDAGPFGRGAP